MDTNLTSKKEDTYYNKKSEFPKKVGTEYDVIFPNIVIPFGYIIYKTGSIYYCLNGSTGAVLSSNVAANVPIQYALDQKNGAVFIKAGIYAMSAGLTYYSGSVIIGEGPGNTILNYNHPGAGNALTPDSTVTAFQNNIFRDFQIRHARTGIVIRDCWNPLLINVNVFSCELEGLVIDGGTLGASGITAIHCNFNFNGYGATFGVSVATGFITINRFIGCMFVNSTSNNIILATEFGAGAGLGITNNTFDNCQIDEAGGNGFDLGHEGITVSNTTFIDCYFDGNTNYDLRNRANAVNTKIISGFITNSGKLDEVTPVKKFMLSFITENWGTSTGTGAQQTIAHGCGTIPTLVLLADKEIGANAYQSAAADATNIYITAIVNQDYSWYVRVY